MQAGTIDAVSSNPAPGRVTDLRPESRRMQLFKSYTGDFEGSAARVIAGVTGEHVIIQDDGSHDSMPDLRIDYAQRPPGYVEVVVDIDQDYAAMAAQVFDYSPFPADWAWKVHIDVPSPKLKELRHQLPKLLGHLHEPPEPQLRRQLTAMGLSVYGPWEPTPNRPPGIHIRAEGVAGSANWETFLQWIRDFLTSKRTRDVRDKLAATSASERHAFIATSFTSPNGAYFSLSRNGYPHLPPRDPELPPEITHLWTWSLQLHNRCLAWLPASGWIDIHDHWPGHRAPCPPDGRGPQ